VKQKGPRRSHAAGPEWWTQSQPIRTLAEMRLTFSLLCTKPPFVYQQVAEKARELSRLGMSACAIARVLKVTDKTVTKALRYHESGPKGTEPSNSRSPSVCPTACEGTKTHFATVGLLRQRPAS